MGDEAKKLLPILANLSKDDQFELLEFLRASLGVGYDREFDPEEWDPEYVAEINRRIESIRNGTAKSIPGDEVMDRLRKKFG